MELKLLADRLSTFYSEAVLDLIAWHDENRIKFAKDFHGQTRSENECSKLAWRETIKDAWGLRGARKAHRLFVFHAKDGNCCNPKDAFGPTIGCPLTIGSDAFSDTRSSHIPALDEDIHTWDWPRGVKDIEPEHIEQFALVQDLCDELIPDRSISELYG